MGSQRTTKMETSSVVLAGVKIGYRKRVRSVPARHTGSTQEVSDAHAFVQNSQFSLMEKDNSTVLAGHHDQQTCIDIDEASKMFLIRRCTARDARWQSFWVFMGVYSVG
ncbi:hypothetical protein HPB50_006798 [Hyalomma asiaticum]|uniref:Uncharacterized protein n=1 Tax=Hyalomma asiaticum TaxID=266040 RepID=A0ACB7SSA1_HYAAI|nr:hypothetical protein HPB50_006798 [Hyalomma asiaticum]